MYNDTIDRFANLARNKADTLLHRPLAFLTGARTACDGKTLRRREMPRTIVSTVLLALSVAANAGDIAAGKAKSVMCAACHGSEGVSSNPQWPNLAGQKEVYLRRQIKAFRDGERDDPMMTPMARPLTDEDIANLAAYYASLKP